MHASPPSSGVLEHEEDGPSPPQSNDEQPSLSTYAPADPFKAYAGLVNTSSVSVLAQEPVLLMAGQAAHAAIKHLCQGTLGLQLSSIDPDADVCHTELASSHASLGKSFDIISIAEGGAVDTLVLCTNQAMNAACREPAHGQGVHGLHACEDSPPG